MSTTPSPLVWDFYRVAGAKSGICGVTDFYDRVCQSIYLSGGNIITDYGTAQKGDWKRIIYNHAAIEINNILMMSLDHPANQVLYFATSSGTGFEFKRYLYAQEVGDYVDAGSWQKSNGNEIEQCNASIMNIDSALFESDITLFQPGSKITVKVAMGDSEPYSIGVAYADEVVYSKSEESASISGRNQLGYLLSDTIIGSKRKTINGSAFECAEKILNLAGVEDYVIYSSPPQPQFNFSFKRDRTLLYCLHYLCNKASVNWDIAELADGKIIVGPRIWINQNYESTGFYQFERGREVFSRQITRHSDAAYKGIYLVPEHEINSMKKSEMLELCEEKGIDTVDSSNTAAEIREAIIDAGFGITEVEASVNNFEFWGLPAQKIYYEEGIAANTQSDLQEYADRLCRQLQYIGITESYESPFRPQLLIGDVAQMYESGDIEAITLGVITDITHNFGKQGFTSNFTIDSGGEAMEQTSTAVISDTKSISGYNRNQNITDLIKKAK